jgi:dihydrofolate reductase
MRKVILYISMSLDGYIADKNGGVDWICGDGSDQDNPGSYCDFFETVDTIIMGYKTYHQIVTKLSPNEWVYSNKKSFVVTHKRCVSSEEICFTDKELPTLIGSLKSETGKDMWICGGANIINQLIASDLIGQYYVTVIPTILGDGIPLFSHHKKEYPLKLISTHRYNGMIDLVYERKQ